jgi:hypothetical protein
MDVPCRENKNKGKVLFICLLFDYRVNIILGCCCWARSQNCGKLPLVVTIKSAYEDM